MKKTIHISCGKDHTAVLTKDGAVFTFGSGQYGQLGHNSFSNEPRPRLVAELWGSKVTKFACGRNHTLVMTDSKRLYSFGCGEQGQLGHGEETHPSVPLPVHLPQGHIQHISTDSKYNISWDGAEVDLDPQNPEKPVRDQNKYDSESVCDL
ncbi:probable E3 ubiquitin-protein ligase HERC3 [Centropristis striata]|uniref:probable E3 ubiquitin-protein ligase HERC3 n=1 Tax=Centropristis striata TaxID=184440 RepID=UPI0027E18988|nr:probable E3 ubiquitin-protein ligase HERC3 [Centropristis striata]